MYNRKKYVAQNFGILLSFQNENTRNLGALSQYRMQAALRVPSSWHFDHLSGMIGLRPRMIKYHTQPNVLWNLEGPITCFPRCGRDLLTAIVHYINDKSQWQNKKANTSRTIIFSMNWSLSDNNFSYWNDN
jgi:hypothetical protein